MTRIKRKNVKLYFVSYSGYYYNKKNINTSWEKIVKFTSKMLQYDYNNNNNISARPGYHLPSPPTYSFQVIPNQR